MTQPLETARILEMLEALNLRAVQYDEYECGLPLHNDQAFEDMVKIVRSFTEAPAEKPVPKCSGCGTTENLHRDLGSGGPYRCDSPDCVVF